MSSLSVAVAVTLAGLCPDWETWDPQKKEENASEAMQLADDWLGIPQVGVCCRLIGLLWSLDLTH